jgi:hypothetical protein
MNSANKKQPGAAQMLRRLRVEQGPAQWHTEAARLYALFQSSGDSKHLRAYQRLSAAISQWDRDSES